jgi:hypothetical protein
VKSRDPDFVKKFERASAEDGGSRLRAHPPHLGAHWRARPEGASADKAAANCRKRVPPALNKFVETIIAANPPVSPSGAT